MPVKTILIDITPEFEAWLEEIEKEPPLSSPIARAIFARLRQLVDEQRLVPADEAKQRIVEILEGK